MSEVWLITGASRGLGRAILEAALHSGAKVLATARDITRFVELQAQYGANLATFELDVTDEQQARHAVAEAVRRFGRLDVLVNNAGFGHIQPFEHIPTDDFRAEVETNLFGVVNLTRAAIPVMRAQGRGHIFQVSSAGGRIASPGLSAYQAAKWAVGGFSDVVGKRSRRSASRCAPWSPAACVPTGATRPAARSPSWPRTTWRRWPRSRP